MKDYFGQLVQYSDCEHAVLVLNDGKHIGIVDTWGFPDVPLNEHLKLTLDGFRLVTYSRDQSVAAAPRSTHTDLALVRVSARPLDVGDLALVKARAKKVQDLKNRIYQGHRTIKVTGFMLPIAAEDRIHLFNDELYRRIQEHVGPGFNRIQLVGGSSASNCGIAQVGGDRAITHNPWQCGFPTTTHEDFHNDGVRHAWKDGIEYREVDRIMGSGSGDRLWMNAPHLYHQGALENEHVETLLNGESGHVHLVDFNTLEMAVPMRARRMILLRQPGVVKMLAVSLDDDHLDVHKPTYDNSIRFHSTDHVATVKVGEPAVVAGRKIVLEKIVDGIASVVIDDAAARNIRPTHPEVESIPLDDCSGAWGNPHWGAQGVHIHRLNESQLSVAWLTWDHRYNTVPYTGILEINGNVATGMLKNASGEHATDVRLFLINEQEGAFYARVGNELFATPLQRLSRAMPDRLQGMFKRPDGSLLTVETAQNGNQFGYLINREVNAALGRTTESWQAFQNQVIYQVSGGMRGGYTDDEDRLKRVGQIAFIENGVEINSLFQTLIPVK